MQPADREYRNMVLRLTDLTVHEDLLDDVTFFNCQIIGPAVIVPLGETEISNCGWDGDFDSVIWPLSSSRERIIGAVGLNNCRVFNCRLTRIGLAVAESQLETVRSAFMSPDQ